MKKCIECEKVLVNKKSKFCSSECFNKNIFKQGMERYEKGLVIERAVMKRYFLVSNPYECTICHISEWIDKPISLHLDHIDGNPSNNNPNNLRLLCPNCHSQTPFYGAKNKGSGRKSRGMALR